MGSQTNIANPEIGKIYKFMREIDNAHEMVVGILSRINEYRIDDKYDAFVISPAIGTHINIGSNAYGPISEWYFLTEVWFSKNNCAISTLDEEDIEAFVKRFMEEAQFYHKQILRFQKEKHRIISTIKQLNGCGTYNKGNDISFPRIQ